MTAIDPTPAHAEPEPSPIAADHDWAQYAAEQFDQQKRAGVAVTMDVQIASEIAATFEIRDLRYDVHALTVAIRSLEPLVRDQTATIRALLAAQQQGGQFGLDEADAAVRAIEENGAPRAAAGG